MPALERLFHPGDKDRLYPVIARRVSCRGFAAPLSTADWAAVSYLAGRYQLPGARLYLTRVEESLFTGTLLGPGRVTGCQAVAVVVASSSIPRARLYAGVLGEALCLEAERKIHRPEASFHSSVKETCERAEALGVRNLVLCHTEDTHGSMRKTLYTVEGKNWFSGTLLVPDDQEILTLI